MYLWKIEFSDDSEEYLIFEHQKEIKNFIKEYLITDKEEKYEPELYIYKLINNELDLVIDESDEFESFNIISRDEYNELIKNAQKLDYDYSIHIKLTLK